MIYSCANCGHPFPQDTPPPICHRCGSDRFIPHFVDGESEVEIRRQMGLLPPNQQVGFVREIVLSDEQIAEIKETIRQHGDFKGHAVLTSMTYPSVVMPEFEPVGAWPPGSSYKEWLNSLPDRIEKFIVSPEPQIQLSQEEWERIAKNAFTAYSESRAGKSVTGSPIPTWEALYESALGINVKEAWVVAVKQVAVDFGIRPNDDPFYGEYLAGPDHVERRSDAVSAGTPESRPPDGLVTRHGTPSIGVEKDASTDLPTDDGTPTD